MRLNDDNFYLRERDELLAHLVDDGTISAATAARERCRARGICSEPDCEQAIDGWCEECGAKLCDDDLELHRHFGCDTAHEIAVDNSRAMMARQSERSDGDGR